MTTTETMIPVWRQNAPAGVPLARLIDAAKPTPAPAAAAPNWGMERIIRPQARNNWIMPRLRTITPDYVEMILSTAIAGNISAQHELFSLMEDTWPRLQKNLAELKRAVLRMEWKVEPWAEDDAPPTDSAKEKASLVSNALWRMRPAPETDENGFQDTLFDVLDAWGKGVSVLEILWEQRPVGNLGEFTMPRATVWVPPENYGWDAAGGLGMAQPFTDLSQPRIGNPTNELTSFPPDKFIFAICRARTGHPLAGALLRPLAWWWIAANFCADWYLNFAQIFGLPIRWATYDTSQPGLEAKLAAMLEQMGSSGWAAMPTGTQLELKDPAKDGTNNPTASMMDRADTQCDLLILGQTLTGTVGSSGSLALGEVHLSVREDIILAAAEWAEDIIDRQLVPMIMRLNYGDDSEAPEISAEPRREQDWKANAERDRVLMDAGVAMPRDWFYERHDIPLPQGGEETVGGPRPTMYPGSSNPYYPPPDKMDTTTPPTAPAQASGIHQAHALHARSAQEKLADTVLEDLTGVEAAWLGGARPWFRKLIIAARDPEIRDDEFLALLTRAKTNIPAELSPLLHPEAVAVALEAALGASCVNGAVSAHLKRRAARQ